MEPAAIANSHNPITPSDSRKGLSLRSETRGQSGTAKVPRQGQEEQGGRGVEVGPEWDWGSVGWASWVGVLPSLGADLCQSPFPAPHISIRSGDPMGREPLKAPVQKFQVPGQVLTLNLRCSQSKGLKGGMSS